MESKHSGENFQSFETGNDIEIEKEKVEEAEDQYAVEFATNLLRDNPETISPENWDSSWVGLFIGETERNRPNTDVLNPLWKQGYETDSIPNRLRTNLADLNSTNREVIKQFINSFEESKKLEALMAVDLARCKEASRRYGVALALGSIPGTPTHGFDYKFRKNYQRFKNKILAGQSVNFMSEDDLGKNLPIGGYSLMIAGAKGETSYSDPAGSANWSLEFPVFSGGGYGSSCDSFIILKPAYFLDKIAMINLTADQLEEKFGIRGDEFTISEGNITDNDYKKINSRLRKDVGMTGNHASNLVTSRILANYISNPEAPRPHHLLVQDDWPFVAVGVKEDGNFGALPINPNDIDFFLELKDLYYSLSNGLFGFRLMSPNGHFLTPQEWEEEKSKVISDYPKIAKMFNLSSEE